MAGLMARRKQTPAAALGAAKKSGAASSVPSEASAAMQGAAAGGVGEGSGGNAVPQPEAKALVVVVTGPRKGRWRAGWHFTAEPVTIPLEDLTEDARAALINDPMLTVETREAD